MPIMNTVIAGGGAPAPTGTMYIISNGTYNVADKAIANVNVPTTTPNYYIKKNIDGVGKLVVDSTQTTLSVAPATDVGVGGMRSALAYSQGISAVDCSSLTSISGSSAFAYAFAQSAGINSYDFSNLTTISGSRAFENAFSFISTGATSVSFPSLTAITGSRAFTLAFSGNSKITTVTFGNTAAITLGTKPFGDDFEGMFMDCYQDITVNAPLANKAEIEALSGYPNFDCGGTVTWNWRS